MEHPQSLGNVHPHSFEIIKAVERKAEDLLTDRYTMIELDKKRQKAREAIRAIKQLTSSDDKQWLCLGLTFVKFEKDSALSVLQNDYDKIDEEIEQTRKAMKQKYSELGDLERRKEVSGFQLNPLSQKDRLLLQTELFVGRTSNE